MARFTLFTHSRKGEGSVQLALDDHGDDDVNYVVHCVVNMSHPSQYPAVFRPNFAILDFPFYFIVILPDCRLMGSCQSSSLLVI